VNKSHLVVNGELQAITIFQLHNKDVELIVFILVQLTKAGENIAGSVSVASQDVPKLASLFAVQVCSEVLHTRLSNAEWSVGLNPLTDV
jgi:hypothetical protein